MNFTETPQCKSKSMCIECRNNEQFRANLIKQFGEWECPEGIAINTPIENFPADIQEKYKNRIEMIEKRKRQMEEVKNILNDLEEIIPESFLDSFDKVRFFIFPKEKTPQICIHKGNPKRVNELCCGGKFTVGVGFVGGGLYVVGCGFLPTKVDIGL